MKKMLTRLYTLFIVCLFITSISIQAQDTSNSNDLIPDLIGEINLWRLSLGLEPLVYNLTLEQMAISQADFLMSLASIPNDIHAGRSGEDARTRSQFPEFQWATYGHPELFAITEIAAIGSIETAMAFWRTSDIHRRSALNPTYREVGIATRQLGTDSLFIVVLGGQPDVLPVLSDPDLGEIYLTNERNEWGGTWIGTAINYRLLDLDLQPITAWAEWMPRVELPDEIDDVFYVEYEDIDGKRIISEVQINPSWYTVVEAQIVDAVNEENSLIITSTPTLADSGVFVTNTPMGAGSSEDNPTQSSIFATNTPISIPTPTLAPSSTPVPSPTMIPPTPTPIVAQSIQLIYSELYFTLYNNSGNWIDLYALSFRNGEITYDAFLWELPMIDLNIGALPTDHCLQIGGFDISNSINQIDSCEWMRSFVTISVAEFFWLEGDFEVLDNGVLIGTCSADENVCEITLD